MSGKHIVWTVGYVILTGRNENRGHTFIMAESAHDAREKFRDSHPDNVTVTYVTHPSE